MRLSAFADEASVDLLGQIDALKRNNIEMLEIRGVNGENIKNISVVEDSSVDRGGCIVETDFGAIDARISSQLTELEQRILEISPIKTITKTSAIKQDF